MITIDEQITHQELMIKLFDRRPDSVAFALLATLRRVKEIENPPPCQHTNRKCVYDSADGEYETWQCNDCGHRWGVEIPQ